MFYSIDHLTGATREAFEATYAAIVAAEESGSVTPENLDRADDFLAFAAAADSNEYSMPLIQEAWEWLT